VVVQRDPDGAALADDLHAGRIGQTQHRVLAQVQVEPVLKGGHGRSFRIHDRNEYTERCLCDQTVNWNLLHAYSECEASRDDVTGGWRPALGVTPTRPIAQL